MRILKYGNDLLMEECNILAMLKEFTCRNENCVQRFGNVVIGLGL